MTARYRATVCDMCTHADHHRVGCAAHVAPAEVSGPWENSDVPRGTRYDRRFEDLAASGMDMHGEAALVASYAPEPRRCSMRGAAPGGWRSSSAGAATRSSGSTSTRRCSRRPAPRRPTSRGCAATWPTPGSTSDGQTFDVVVMAGNVLIFVPPGTEGQVIDNAARWLRPGGPAS